MLDKSLLLALDSDASMYRFNADKVIVWQPLPIAGDKLTRWA